MGNKGQVAKPPPVAAQGAAGGVRLWDQPQPCPKEDSWGWHQLQSREPDLRVSQGCGVEQDGTSRVRDLKGWEVQVVWIPEPH